MESSFPSPRRLTAREATATFLLLLPFLCSLVYRLYAKVQRRSGRSVGLQILSKSSSDEDAKYEIVAVHGLGANPEHTWTCKPTAKSRSGDAQAPVHLLKDLLMKDDRFSDARILHFAYNSDWLVDACFQSARDIGLRLMESLIKHRETHARLPLIFVGHSFGGIVIKEALSSNPDDTQKVLEDTSGVIFLGTPHLGSPIAGYGATIAYLTGFLGSDTGLLLSLRSTGEFLVNLSRDFQRCMSKKEEDTNKKTRIVSICEKRPSYLLNWLYAGKIVPWESAAFGANIADVIEVDKDHSGLNKCLDSGDPLYKELTAQLYKIRPNTPPKINRLQQAVIDRLAPVIASEAEFNPGFDEYGRGRLECLPKTRERLLNEICDWFDDSHSSQKHIYWLQGKAGTGKSTIARTVVGRMARKKRIVVNFFFKRGEGDRARLKRFFTTLSAQLVRRLPSLATMVQDALESDPSLPEQHPRIQFKKLVQEPLQKQISSHYKPIVVVIDALDECDSKEDLTLLVQQLSQPIVRTDGDCSSSGQSLVKLFLTSRLDHHTQSDFNGTPERICEKKEFESVTSDTSGQDIERYLRLHLEKIPGFLDPLPGEDPWSNPSDVEILKKLTERARPLFEFAAAACRFIAQSTATEEPRELLHDILESNVYGDLDGVYLPILNRRFFGLKGRYHEQAKAQFQKVIGSVLSLADSVTVACLSKLLGQPEPAIRKELRHFESVLVVPVEQDYQSHIKLFHESFRDFLIGPEASENFRLDSVKAHTLLAARCLDLMRGALKENICAVKSPGIYRIDVTEETVQESLSEEVQYACRYWIYHLRQCGLQLRDGDDWHLFLTSHFLHWLEALSWLGRASETVLMVRELKIITHSTNAAQLRAFIDDADRFILYFHQIIESVPLQLYSSALTFSPSESVIRKTFDACRSKWIARTPTVKAQWSPCLQTLEGHGTAVTCVTFSSEGILASGDRGGTVKIWDPKLGTCLQTLRIGEEEEEEEEEGYRVSAMAFSEAGRLACQTKRSIVLWDMNQRDSFQKLTKLDLGDVWNGSVVFVDKEKLLFGDERLGKVFESDLEHESQTIFSAAYECDLILSCDGQWVACADDRETKIFHMNNKHPPYVLPQDEERIREEGGYFSRDNRYFASGRDIASIQIWDVASQTSLGILNDTQRSCVATFSPDGRLLATGGYWGSVSIWEFKTLTRLGILTGHSGIINSLAFSPDGAWLASASEDGTVKIWDVSSDSFKHSKEDNETFSIEQKVSIAMDGQRFVTSSYEASTYQLWDKYGKVCTALPFKSNWNLAISADGNISAACSDNNIEIWDVETGSRLPKPDGNWDASSSRVRSIALSANGERLVTGSTDGRVGLWETRTGQLLMESRHRGPKRSIAVAISSDGKQVASPVDSEIWVEDSSGEKFTRLAVFDGTHRLAIPRYVGPLVFSLNGDRLASVDNEFVTTIWDLTTGAPLRRFEGPPSAHHFAHVWGLHPSFTNFDFDTAANLPESLPREECLIKHHINNDGDWIMRHSQKLLWLPPEYRPTTAAASGSSIAIARASARPYVIGLSDDGLDS